MKEDDLNTHQLALEFVGQFARLQELIEGAGRLYFHKKTPELERFLQKKLLDRMRDEDRIDFLKGMFKDLEVEPPTKQKEVFNQVKKVRDQIAHSSSLEAHPADSSLILSKDFFGGFGRNSSTPSVVSRADLFKMKWYCDWLAANVYYLISVSDITVKIIQNGVEISHVRPTDHPDQWDGAAWQPAGSSA